MDADTAALVARLRQLSASAVSDVLDRCGYPGQALASTIRPLAKGMTLAGPALCFGGVTLDGGANAAGLDAYAIDRRIVPGAVVVIATHGHRVAAVMGGLMALSFSLRHCAGMVTDGGVRDAGEIESFGLATFCAYTAPLNSAGRWQMTLADSRVELPAQTTGRVGVDPGDLLIGDADGVMVIPRAIAPAVIEWTERLAMIEEAIMRALRAGEPREAVFAANPRFAHIGRLR